MGRIRDVARNRLRLQKVSMDKDILTRPVLASMKMHRVPHYVIKAAQHIVRDGVLASEGPEGLEKRATVVKCRRLQRTLDNLASSYQDLLPSLLQTNNMAAIGKRYGISRERVRQIHGLLAQYASFTGRDVVAVVNSLGGDLHS